MPWGATMNGALAFDFFCDCSALCRLGRCLRRAGFYLSRLAQILARHG